MPIGVVAERTGVSPRMIRYHEAHGHLPSRGRTAGRQRNFDEQDVHWLRNLQTQLAAGVPTPTAMRALRGELSGLEQEAIDRALAEWQRAYIPGHLQTTYRLDFLGQRAARVAIQRSRASVKSSSPTTQQPCWLTKLGKVLVARPCAAPEEVDAPYIQPFQLQVVCRRLWGAPTQVSF